MPGSEVRRTEKSIEAQPTPPVFLDPRPPTPFTTHQHLRRAKELLAELHPTDSEERADLLYSAISQHTTEAEKDEQIKPEAKTVVHALANKLSEVIANRVWASPRASDRG
jgi:hypothetical protein